MEQNSTGSASTVTSLGSKSWTAYVAPMLGAFVLLLLTAGAWYFSTALGVVVLVCSIALISYGILVLKSFNLYFDDMGVWVYSGILPWSKGVRGVKWRDLDEAVYFQSMASWLFKSYTIRIGHRFTKSSEIVLTSWNRGHEAVVTINAKHQELVRANALG